MLTAIIRGATVMGVLAFAAMALGVRPATGAGSRDTNASGASTPQLVEDDRGLVRLTEPEDAEAAAALAVEQVEDLGSDATVTRAGGFIIVSDADARWTQVRAALIQRAHHQYERFADRLGFALTEPEEPLLCVLINDHDAYTRFAQAHDGVQAGWVAGYYASLSNRIVFYNDETSPAAAQAAERLAEYDRVVTEARTLAAQARKEKRADVAASLEARAGEMGSRLKAERKKVERSTRVSAEAKAVHEAVHLLAFNTGLQRRDRQYPFWLTEGLASSFETERTGAAFGPDHEFAPRRKDFDRLRDADRLLPLEVLVQLNSVPDDDEETAEVMYAQSYTLFRYLFRYERAALAEFFRDYLREPAGRIGPKRQLELFRARFGDVAALERVFLKRG